MGNYEIVQRGKTVYIRKKPKRDFDSSSYYRKLHLLNFAEIARKNRGKSYEEFIESLRSEIKPVGRKKKIRQIELTEDDILDLRYQMLVKGIRRLELPLGTRLVTKKALKLAMAIK